jgi:myo-inositol 2-dehydrogenase/D-chiro-inositol 1-dehydrogenase
MRIGLAGVGRIGAFHAETLLALDEVDTLVVTDADSEVARNVADRLGAEWARDADALLASRPDGFVIATATPAHATLLGAGVAAGVPTFCEKPVAATLEETIDLARLMTSTEVPVHVGFQRRFDPGYQRVRQAVQDGELGFVHTIRANTFDMAPPPAAYIRTSGGIFRDCNIHDFDVLRYITGREVATAYATGGNKGEQFFTDAGDVDTGAALLTLDDATMVLVSSGRYNGAGHDVRMEVMGEKGSLAVGLDQSLALTSAQEGVDFPTGPAATSFMERFRPAYRAELTAFVQVARGETPSPCTVSDALQAFRIAHACDLSRRDGRVVRLEEIDNL